MMTRRVDARRNGSTPMSSKRGRQVADAARKLRPGLKVLFITGFAENAALSHGRVNAGMSVLTKPFAMEALAARVKGLLV